MNTRDLLFLLKKEAEDISAKNLIKINISNVHCIHPPGSIQYKSELMTKYNFEIFSEIKNKNDVSEIEYIDTDFIRDFIFRIDRYIDENAPGQDSLKRYIRLVSIYLTFIAKMPLHPPGMVMSEGTGVIQLNGKFYCSMKSKNLREKFSLCEYCISSDIVGMY